MNMFLKKMILLIATLPLFFSTVSGMQNQGKQSRVVNMLELVPGQGLERVELPFPYKHLTAGERAHVVWVPELFYTVIEPGSRKLAVAGPLQPCLLIAMKNNITGRVVIFHKPYTCSMNSILDIATRELDVRNPGDISGLIFTNHKIDPNFIELFKHTHQGRTIMEEVKLVKDLIVARFNIQDRTQISAILNKFDLEESMKLGVYPHAELFVAIGADFIPYSTSMFHEDIFSEMAQFKDLPLEFRLVMFQNILDKRTSELDVRFNGLVADRRLFATYGVVPCLRIDA